MQVVQALVRRWLRLPGVIPQPPPLPRFLAILGSERVPDILDKGLCTYGVMSVSIVAFERKSVRGKD